MSGIELVINIPEEEYNTRKKTGYFSDNFKILEAVANGTPLPKGHGRLIDADELKKIIEKNDPLAMAGFNVRLIDINSAPTIIEAESEDKE